MDMQLTPISSEEAIFHWSSDHSTSPDIEDVEEIIRQQHSGYRGESKRPRMSRAVTTSQLRIEEFCGGPSSIDLGSFKFGRFEMRAGSMEGSDGSNSSAITIITAGTSATSPSSRGDPWSASVGFVEGEEDHDHNHAHNHDHEYHNNNMEGGEHGREEMEQDQEDTEMLVPKLEPMEEDSGLTLAIATTEVPRTPLRSPAQTKRPRGRPRKHPVPTPESMAKVAKGRSKTGCITCRRRKKKCDEAKPKCNNCEKNAVICEGYPDKQLWKSGKEKVEEARLRRVSIPSIHNLAPVIHGVETAGDKVFFEHYIFKLSSIFTVEGERNNAFKDMLLPMAVQHLGLMHSILALSSKHIDYDSEYGKEILKSHPDVDKKSLEERSEYHQHEALKELQLDMGKRVEGANGNAIISARYGQMLCLVLETLADDKPTGQHRVHLNAYQSLIQSCPPEEGPFLEFIKEFFQYHIVLDELIYLPEGRARLGAVYDDWNIPENIIQSDAVRLLGVNDGLFLYMSKITNIRNSIRDNITNGVDPIVDYTSLYRAAEIDAGIRDWKPVWPAGDARDLGGLLYKQMMWVYLWRTIYPPKTTTWQPDQRITQAVDDGIVLLSQIPSRDPTQTIVLAPAFIIGCAAFEERQREPIRKAIGVVKEYMQYRNSDAALRILEEIWKLMDRRDERSWDWQSVARNLGMDFLAT